MPKTRTKKRKSVRKTGYQERERRYDSHLAKLPARQFAREMQRGADHLRRVLTGS